MMRVEPSAQTGRPTAIGKDYADLDNQMYSVRARTARTVLQRDYEITPFGDIDVPDKIPRAPLPHGRRHKISPMTTTWWNVLLDGAAHGCYIANNEPPQQGQEPQLGSIYAYVDQVTTGQDGTPLILASRRPMPQNS